MQQRASSADAHARNKGNTRGQVALEQILESALRHMDLFRQNNVSLSLCCNFWMSHRADVKCKQGCHQIKEEEKLLNGVLAVFQDE